MQLETATSGHSAVAGGLRGHSLGDTYPETVIGKGDGFALLNLLTGEEGPTRATYDEARFHRELNQPCPRECPKLAAADVTCHTCGYWTSAHIDQGAPII